MRSPREQHVTDNLKELATLQVRHTDAANGYQKGVENADAEMKPMLESLVELHDRSAGEAADILKAHGGEPDDDGSWMSWVHETIMSVRGTFDDIDQDVIPGIIDGEQRILDQIGTVLSQDVWTEAERATIEAQRDRINSALASLREHEDS